MPSRTAPSSSAPRQPPTPPLVIDNTEHYDVAKHFAAVLIDEIRKDWGSDEEGAKDMVKCILLSALTAWRDYTDYNRNKSAGFERLIRKLDRVENGALDELLNVRGEVGLWSDSPARNKTLVRKSEKKKSGKGKAVKVEERYSPPPPTQPMTHKASKIPGPHQRPKKRCL